ncbi:MAG: hypothetical protein AAF804_09255, partial [Bacteroidota bacterium]
TTTVTLYQGDRVTVVVGPARSPASLDSLANLDQAEVALFIPMEWLTLRDHRTQDWTVNDPKSKSQETLYSTTFFFHFQHAQGSALLELAKAKGWAVYTMDEEKVYCLVMASGIAFDVNRERLFKHLEEA